MTEPVRLDVLARGWRGRLLAALIALIAGLPGLLTLPITDRDEARFAQVTAQMLESGDFVGVDDQDEPLNNQPVLIHWLQAGSVALFSSAEARAVWAYRIPSLLGAMLAAAACVWGAEAFFGAAAGFVAGAILAASMALSIAADLATTDALLCGAANLSMAAFARLYATARGELAAGWRTKLLFWLGLALAILDKGPVAPVVAILAGTALAIWDRGAPWAKSLGWTWGLLLICAVVGPWAIAITVRTDGAYWAGALGGQASRAHPPGFHALLAAVLLFPATVLLPAAGVEAWKARTNTGVRFAIAWLVPAWLLFELLPGKATLDTLPLYGAIAWLASFALTRPLGLRSRWAGAGLSLLVGVGVAVAIVAVWARFGAPRDLWLALLAAGLALLAAAAGGAVLFSRYALAALAASGAFAVAAHAVTFAAVLPRLSGLWTSAEAAAALDRAKLNPRDGLTPGPVAAVGYGEPSLVFLLGAETEIGDVGDAAEAISEGRPAVIEQGHDAAFRAELAADKLKASPAGAVAGFDYSLGRPVRLTVYRSDSPPPAPDTNAP
jgi:4-amino-4-deoxy-L-arabinose transferase-like glycosyltransferase